MTVFNIVETEKGYKIYNSTEGTESKITYKTKEAAKRVILGGLKTKKKPKEE